MAEQRWFYGDESLIKEFFEMYDSGKYYIYEIAEWFGISTSCVHKTAKNRAQYAEILKKEEKEYAD